MIAPHINKLLRIRSVGPNAIPCIEDCRIGMEMLKKEHYPNMPVTVAHYLFTQVRYEIVDEYCTYQEHSGYKSLKWRE